MKLVFSSFLLIIFLAACSDKDKLPADVLPPAQMREVLWDMVRAGEFVNSFVFFKDSSIDKVAESQKWNNKIFQLHHTSKEKFDKSFAYYKDHPVLFKDILDSLSKRPMGSQPGPEVKYPPGGPKEQNIDTIRNQDTLRRKFDTLIRKRILDKRKFRDTLIS